MRTCYLLLATVATLTTSPALAQATADPAAADIVVTATRRAESVQDIASLITVYSGERLNESGVDNLLSMESLTPGVRVQSQAVSANIYIRGIGTQGFGSDPSAPLFIDGVYTARGSNALFFDLARVEVLKGPQGTLYGRNAVAGAVNMVSAPPIDRLETSFRVGYGSFERVSAEGMFNVPIGDNSAIRASLRRVKDDGYLSNGGNQAADFGARLQGRTNMSEAVTLTVIGDYYKQDGRGPSTIPLFAPTGTTVGICSGERFCQSDDPWFTPEAAGDVQVENWGVTAKLSADLGGMTLMVQPAHRVSKQDQFSFVNNNQLGSDFDIATKQSSIDVNLISDDDGPFKWIVGGSYYSENTIGNQLIRVQVSPTFLFNTIVEIDESKSASYAFFAEGTYSLSDALRVRLGARYTDEDRSQSGQGYNVRISGPPPLQTPIDGYVIDGTFSDSRITWNAELEYDLSRDSMLYASAKTGFKSGGINREAPNDPVTGDPFDNTYRSERLTAFALGSKNRFLGGRAIVNVEAFYWLHKDRQNQQFSALNSAAPPSQTRNLRTFNLGDTKIWGVEVASSLRMGDGGQLELSGAYLNAKYMNDPDNVFPASTILTQTFSGLATLVVEPGADLRGKVVAFSPKWSGNIAYSHNFSMGDIGSLKARVESQFQTVNFTQYRLAPESRQPGYTKTSLSLTWTDPSDHVSLTGFVRNIENEAVVRTVAATALTAATPLYFGYIEAPRTWGVELGAKF